MDSRNPLCRMFKYKSGGGCDSAAKSVDLDDSTASPASTKQQRPNLFSRLHQNLKRDRRDHRTKLVDQNRVLQTPNKTPMSSMMTQSTTNLHHAAAAAVGASAHLKKQYTSSVNLNNNHESSSSAKSKFTSIFSKFPTKKPTTSATSSHLASSTSGGGADSTYVVPNCDEDNESSSLNVSKGETGSSLRRRKMLEEYLKSKKDLRQQQEKSKKPAFKVGLASSSGLSASTSKLNTSGCSSSNISSSCVVPSRPTFDFKMSLPKPTELARSTSTRTLPTSGDTHSTSNLARSNTIRNNLPVKTGIKPPVAANKPVTRSNTIKPSTINAPSSSRPTTASSGVHRTASSVKPAIPAKPKLPAATATGVATSKHQKDMDHLSKKLTETVRINNNTKSGVITASSTPMNNHHTTINSESIIIVDSHNYYNQNGVGCEPPSSSNLRNLLLDQHKTMHHHRTSSPIKLTAVDLGDKVSSPIVPRQLVSQLACQQTMNEDVTSNQQLPVIQLDQSMQQLVEKTETIEQVATKPVESVEYFESVEMSKRDVEYYRSLLIFQTKRLNELIDEWTSQTSGGHVIPDDIEGEIRLACGLARLLIDERFVQFSGLVNQCEQQNLYDSLNAKDKEEEMVGGGGEEAELKVRCTDLQGFWDMVDSQVQDVAKRFDKLSRLRSNNYVPIEEEVKIVKKKPVVKAKKKETPTTTTTTSEEAKVAEKKPNKFAEFRAKMKAQKEQQSDEVVIEIKTGTPSVQLTATPQTSDDVKTTSSAKKTRRKSRFNQSVDNHAAPPLPSPYNLRSRKSDLICFDSPMRRESMAVVSKLPTMPEESATQTQSLNLESRPPVIKVNKARKSVRINMEPQVQLVDKNEYENEEEECVNYQDADKENEDFFACDIKKEVVTWCSNEKIANRLSFLPKFESPVRVLGSSSSSNYNNTLAVTPNRTLTTSCGGAGNMLDTTPAGAAAATSTRLSISMANSPLLKLAFISSKSKRLSMTNTNQSVLDK